MNKHIKDLIKLSKDNPELEIIPATYFEVMAEDWGYWLGSIEKVEKDYFYMDDDRWLAGYDDILEKIKDDICGDYEYLSDDEFNTLAVFKFYEFIEIGIVKEAIIIFIGLQ